MISQPGQSSELPQAIGKSSEQHHPPKAPAASKGTHGIVGHPTCSATSTQSGERCRCYPMKGSTVCSTHGGMAPQVRNAAARRLTVRAVEAEAKAVLAFEGITNVWNPLGEVVKLAAELRATLDALAARVNALDAIRYAASGSGTEQTRSEMVLLGQYQDRLARLLDMMMRWDFDNRKLLLEENIAKATGLFLSQLLDRILDRLDLTADQRLLLSVVVPEEARKLAPQ